MPNVEKITKQTENPFVNLYLVEGTNKVNHHFRYYVASRAKSIEQMKIKTRKNTPDGVLMYSLYGEKRDKIVLVRQYRVSIDDYIYEFPAGLVEPGEEFHEAAVREMQAPILTGWRRRMFTGGFPLKVDPCYEKPFFTTIGLTDEACSAVYGWCEGEISRKYLEESEVIEVVLADREEAKRILKEENVAIMCSYHLMHFIHDEEPFAFLK